jgi:hypothetical protein
LGLGCGTGTCSECSQDADCPDDHWCGNGLCQTDVCVDPSKRRSCVADGGGFVEETCANGCADGMCQTACEPGPKSCQGEAVVQESCGKVAVVLEDCAKAGKTCLRGQCVAKTCEAGTVACSDGNHLATCKADGSGWNVSACPGGAPCQAGACCDSGLKSCKADVVVQDFCGTMESVIEDCGAKGIAKAVDTVAVTIGCCTRASGGRRKVTMRTSLIPPHRRITAAMILLASLAPSMTWAGPRPNKAAAQDSEAEAESFAAQARDRFKSKDFDAAAKLFMQAYARSPRPALVFNAARAYQEAGKKGDAAGLLRLYISISKDADGIAEAHERLRALEGKPPIQPPVPVQPPAVEQVPGSHPAVGLSGTITPDASPADDTVLKWTVTGTAGLGLVSGIAVMLVARGQSMDANSLTVHDDDSVRAYNDRFDKAQRNWAIGAGLTAIGVGMGVWATWLHVKSGRKPASAAAWNLDVGPAVARLTVGY